MDGSYRVKALIIGDTHFDNNIPGILESQFKTLKKIIDNHKPKIVIFLGDVFHHRKPSPEVIVATSQFFRTISLIPGISNIFILRGNHDSSSKSDDGITVLSVLDYPGSKVRVILHSFYDPRFNFRFIPHYENEKLIEYEYTIGKKNKNTIVFGHFGYSGSLNSMGYFDFNLSKELLGSNRTILGHIHKYSKEENITILGTPWSTNFGEVDCPHYVGIMHAKDSSMQEWGELELEEIKFGVRHYVAPYDSLEYLKEDISNPNYYTVLRVLIDRFSESNPNDMRNKIMEDYKVGYVNLKFQPVFDKKLNNRLSDFDPQKALDNIDGNIIEKYLEEQSSSIPTEILREGLERIISDANTENNG